MCRADIIAGALGGALGFGSWFVIHIRYFYWARSTVRDLGSPLYERLFPDVHEVQLREILGSSIPMEARTLTPEMSRPRRVDNIIEQSKVLRTEMHPGVCSGGIPNPVIPTRL